MSELCSAKQVAEAVCIWSYVSWPIECIEFEDIEDFKCLDIFFSTLMVFCDAFNIEMKESFEEFMEQLSISKTSFIDFLKPRALLLAEKNGYFDFMMVCTYFSQILDSRCFTHSCFHLARVACKLLTRILEDKFGEIFETGSGWENLMLYCRSLHAAVYPSQENRPPGYVPSFKKSLAKWRARNGIEDGKIEESLDEIEENKLKLENNKESSEFFPTELLGVEPEREESRELSSLKDDSSTDSDSITNDTTYWKYFNLDRSIFCRKITHSEEHLKDVYNVLKKLKQDVDANCTSSNSFDITLSEDEYIEQLEKEEEKSNTNFSDFIKELYAKKISEEQNARSGATSCADKVYSEDITDDQIREFISKEYYDDPKCDLCEGKLRSFTKHWEESFHDKYSNWSIVSNVV